MLETLEMGYSSRERSLARLWLFSEMTSNTLPDFPAEIRAPSGTIAGISGFQIHFGSTKTELLDIPPSTKFTPYQYLM